MAIDTTMQMELDQTLTNIDEAGLTLRSQYLNIFEVGTLLRCSRSTVVRMIKKGLLPEPRHRTNHKNSPLLFKVSELARYGIICNNIKISNVDIINTRDGETLIDLPSQCYSTTSIQF